MWQRTKEDLRHWGIIFLCVALIIGTLVAAYSDGERERQSATGRTRTVELSRKVIVAIINSDGQVVTSNGTEFPVVNIETRSSSRMVFTYVTKDQGGKIEFKQYWGDQDNRPTLLEKGSENLEVTTVLQEENYSKEKGYFWVNDKTTTSLFLRPGIIKRMFSIDIGR